jgi:uncharacterized protein (TIGR02118 family)
MIIRSAVLEGTVAEADREAFDRQMTTTVLAAIARYPGIIEVRLRRPVEAEAGAPPVYMVFELLFPSIEAMHAALASPTRQEVRARLGDVMQAFQGKVYHLVLDGGVKAMGAA